MLMIYLSMLENEHERKKFSEIYEDNMHLCLSVAMKITGGNQAMSEDALHDAFLALIRHKDKYLSSSRGKLKSLIVIIVKNKAIDLMRKGKRNISIDDEDNGIVLEDDFDISAYIADADAALRLMEHIAALPEIYKTVFELRYVHDMSNSEIADIIDISSKLVSMRIARAKLMLRDALEKEGSQNG